MPEPVIDISWPIEIMAKAVIPAGRRFAAELSITPLTFFSSPEPLTMGFQNKLHQVPLATKKAQIYLI
jgi:hypothetical protein